MSDFNIKLLQLISNNKSVNEICERLNITNRFLYKSLSLLKNEGLDFIRKYYYSGDIIYVLSENTIKNTNEATIITSPYDNEFRALIISDLHLGCEYERLDLLYNAYEYCIKNGINIIINAGDVMDGMLSTNQKMHNNYEEQIVYIIKNYPFDKNILNFTVLGNHDIESLNSTKIDFAEILNKYRHDIVALGYSEGIINIKNDKILVKHKIPNIDFSHTPKSIIIKGHTHQLKIINSKNGNFTIFAPTLSDLIPNKNNNKINIAPSAIEMHSQYNYGYLGATTFTHLLFTDKITPIHEFNYDLSIEKAIDSNLPIQNEENKIKKI